MSSPSNIPGNPTPGQEPKLPALAPVPAAIAKVAAESKPQPQGARPSRPQNSQHIGRPAGAQAVRRSFDRVAAAGAARTERDHSALFAPADAGTDVVRQRVTAARRLLLSILTDTDRACAQAAALIDEITKYNGGAEAAEKEGFNCAAANKFVAELDALLDSYAPKKG